jgi:3-phosphoshikimate 1-carboxyvinyltransferase
VSTSERELQVSPGPLVGTVVLPGDKSISHRALLIGSLAEGTSRARGLSDGQDVANTADAVRAMGARVGQSSAPGERAVTTIHGGATTLTEPASALDCGNSGTTMRLIAGLVAQQSWNVQLVGDASLSQRPMDRVAEPLTTMGASVTGRGKRCEPPLFIRGGGLRGIEYAPPHASAQIKSCVLLAGLAASGETVVREATPTRRHTEDMLELCGADIEETESDGAHIVRVKASTLRPFDLTVPGDPSQAAFWVVAACVVPGSEVNLPGVYVGKGRRGFLDVLIRMGASVTESEPAESATGSDSADLCARYGPLVATEVHSSEITGLDEVPVLAVAAAVADGTTVFREVGELRVKESDRLAGLVRFLRAFGASADIHGDDLVVHGGARLKSAEYHASGDHRMAMAAAVAATASTESASSVISGWECVQTSYPAFSHDLAVLAADR